jgi:hypothetical protein
VAAAAPPEAPLSFTGVKLFTVKERNKTDDRDVTLTLSNGNIATVDDRGGAVLASLPYSAAVRATYIKARDPKWDTSLPGPPEDLDVGGLLRTSKHWMVLQGTDRYMILRLEDSNWRRVYDAVRERTGLTIVLPANSDKS